MGNVWGENSRLPTASQELRTLTAPVQHGHYDRPQRPESAVHTRPQAAGAQLSRPGRAAARVSSADGPWARLVLGPEGGQTRLQGARPPEGGLKQQTKFTTQLLDDRRQRRTQPSGRRGKGGCAACPRGWAALTGPNARTLGRPTAIRAARLHSGVRRVCRGPSGSSRSCTHWGCWHRSLWTATPHKSDGRTDAHAEVPGLPGARSTPAESAPPEGAPGAPPRHTPLPWSTRQRRTPWSGGWQTSDMSTPPSSLLRGPVDCTWPSLP